MAKKAKVIDYPGDLGCPILIQIVDHPPRPPSSTEFGDFVNRVWHRKLSLLLSYYDIDPEDPQSWERLAFHLALAHVPGFQLELGKHPGGRPWSDDRRAWLAITIDLVKEGHPNLRTDEDACKHLVRAVDYSTKWGPPKNHNGNDGSWIKTLMNRLSEGRKTDFYKTVRRMKGISPTDLFFSSHEKPPVHDEHGSSLGALPNNLLQSPPDNSEK